MSLGCVCGEGNRGSQWLPASLSHHLGTGGRFQAGVAGKMQCQSPGCGTAISLHTLSRPS